MNRCWQANRDKAAQSAYLAVPPLHMFPRHFRFPSGPFIESLANGFHTASSTSWINMFLSWFVCFLTRPKLSLVDSPVVLQWLKISVRKIFPSWGTPFKLHSNRGCHFTGQVL